jgi:nitrite reductase (NADH) small subunit
MNVQLVADNSTFINTINSGQKPMVVCELSDLIENSGICALVEGQQVAIFYLPKTEQKLFAVSNWDPIGKANVISRGIIGDIKGTLVVASPLYKHHFCLETGQCLEDGSVRLDTYTIKIEDDKVIMA